MSTPLFKEQEEVALMDESKGERLTERLAQGACAGFLATLPMSALMLTWQRLLPTEQQYPLPPNEAATAMMAAMMKRFLPVSPPPAPDSPSLIAATWAGHLAYGTAMGALYAALPRRGHPLVRGTAWGLPVWTCSYLGWVPAAGLLRSAATHPAERNALMIGTNLFWGALTGILTEAFAATKTSESD